MLNNKKLTKTLKKLTKTLEILSFLGWFAALGLLITIVIISFHKSLNHPLFNTLSTAFISTLLASLILNLLSRRY